MSALDSNLTSSGYTFDLVTSITQSALNATLKQTLDSIGANSDPLVVYYKQDDADPDQLLEMSAEEVQTYIGNMDVFAIPDGATSDNNADLATIYDWDITFAGGIRATMGVPGTTPSQKQNAPNIVTLQTGSTTDNSQTVNYNVYFNTFDVMSVHYAKKNCTCSQYAQTPDDIFLYQTTIDLNLKNYSSSWDNLPAYMQANIQNILNDPSAMFSIEQLMLDFNTIPPDPNNIIVDIPAGSPIGDSEFTSFVNQYWTLMIQNGDIVFSSSAQPTNVSYPSSSIVPTAVNFVVSPYNTGGSSSLTATQIQNLATLNYLVMTEHHTMPTPAVFDWNWVDSGQSITGIMSVKRDILVDYLNELLSPLLKSLCFTVDCDMRGQSVTLTPVTSNETYTKVQQGNTYLSFDFKSRDEDDTVVSPVNGKLLCSIEVSSNVSLQHNTIVCATSVYVYIECDVDLVSKTYGWPIAQTCTTTFTLNAVGASPTEGNAGLLELLVSSAYTYYGQTSNKDGAYYNGDLDPSWFAQFVSLGSMDDMFDDLKDQCNSIDKAMKSNASSINTFINNNYGFVFPGAQTYFFSNPSFSNHGDLTVQVAYQAID